MGKLTQILKKYYPILIIGFLLFSTHVYWLLINKGLIIFYGDSYQEMLHLYLGGWEKFHALDFNVWEWSLGLGGSYFSYVFYFASSPFFLVSLLLPKAWVPYGLVWLNLLKLAMVYGATYLWINQRFQRKWISTLSALILTFSGWVLFYYHYNFFLDAFMWYPLILYFIDRWFETHQTKGLILSIAALGIINFYFFYMFIPFIGLYFVLRLIQTEPNINFKKGLNHFTDLLKPLLIGTGLASFVLFPSFYAILNSPRILNDSLVDMLKPMTWLNIYRYLSTNFSFVLQRFEPSTYISTQIDPGYGWSGGVSLYSFALSPLVLFRLNALKDKRFVRSFGVLYGFFVIAALFPLFNRLLQGSLDVRWFYLFTLLNVYAIASFLDAKQKGQVNSLTIFQKLLPYGILLSLTLLSIRFGLYGQHKQAMLGNTLLFLGLMAMYDRALFSLKAKSHFILSIAVVEAFLAFTIPMIQDKPMDSTTFKAYFSDTLNQSAERDVSQENTGFNRILVDTGEYTSQNRPFANRYLGTSFYASVYNYQSSDFYDQLSDTYSMPVVFGRFQNNFLLSVNTYISYSKNHWAPFGFVYEKTIGTGDVYTNTYPLELGFAYTQTINEACFKELAIDKRDRVILSQRVGESSNCTAQDRFEPLVYAHEVHESSYYWKKEGGFNDVILTLRSPHYLRATVTYTTQGQFIQSSSFSQYHYLSLYLPPDSTIDGIQLYVETPEGQSLNYSLDIDTQTERYVDWYNETKPFSFTHITFDGDQIDATLTTDAAHRYVATSIPYDTDWVVYVDSEKVDLQKVNLGFIGFDVEAGTHQVHFAYRPKAFYLGCVVSLFSLLIWIRTLRQR